MRILVKDEEGLCDALMMDGYSWEQLDTARLAIRDKFREAAVYVFNTILGTGLPETIIVNMAQNRQGSNAGTLAYFNPRRSSEDELYFYFFEDTVKGFISGKDIGQFNATIIHEMIHAADQPMLDREQALLAMVRERAKQYDYDPYDPYKKSPNTALHKVLTMLNHYRAEGIAILGEHLVSKRAFPSWRNAIRLFRMSFMMTLLNSGKWMSGNMSRDDKASGAEITDFAHDAAYISAPVILSMVLQRRGDIDDGLAGKALKGLETGDFSGLSEADIIKILKASMALSVPGFIQGVLLIGDEVAPVVPLLEFCAKLQGDYDENNIGMFASLVQSPVSADTFIDAMKSIMGAAMDEEELAECYSDFRNDTPGLDEYPHLEEKIEYLFAAIKAQDGPVKKRVAQWALTYLFDDEDLMHDNIPGLGLVDDMLVIDYAIKVLANALATSTTPSSLTS